MSDRKRTVRKDDGGKSIRRKRKSDPNFLPSNLANGFQKELIDLVRSVERDPKGEYLNSEFLSKYSDSTTTPADKRAAAAIEKWLLTDAKNAITNRRISLGDEDFGWVTSDQLIAEARATITKLLGSTDEVLFIRGQHSNGASSRVTRGPTAAYEKHEGKAHVTELALKHWFGYASGSLLGSRPSLFDEGRQSNQCLELVQSSVMFTVPKTSEIDRVACKEPEVNVFLQRLAGVHIRRKLRSKGIDLLDQTVNQRLAHSAYSAGLATIDLSAASDSISNSLVMALLPTEWWVLLDDLRVHSIQLPDGKTHIPEMFSSMGNGFTFELESLIFWALTRAVCKFSGTKGRISVYGDDIICPSSVARRLARVFSWFGFSVNQKKSNWSGPVRESCGKHYHKGFDITPFYLRGPIRQKIDVIRFLNHLLAWDGREARFFETESIYHFHKKWSQVLPREVWGGQDIEDDGCLVTGGRPWKRLIPVPAKVEYADAYAYLWWQTVQESAVEAESDPVESYRYELADNTDWLRHTTWDPYFLWDRRQVQDCRD